MSDPVTVKPTRGGTGCAVFVLAVLGLVIVVAVVQAFDTGARPVSASELEEAWPLTVQEGVLHCSLGLVTLVHEGLEYAVNSAAQRSGKYEDIEPIRAESDSGSPVKKSLFPLVDLGREACGQ